MSNTFLRTPVNSLGASEMFVFDGLFTLPETNSDYDPKSNPIPILGRIGI